jgi:4-amino-4-deoxy-L-arabinose transferase-like glycosyltransferase
MNRTRVVIGFLLGLGLLLVGHGHYYMALLRTEYPLDGLAYYGAAVVCFFLAWRTAQHEKNAVWHALSELWRSAWHEIRAIVLEAEHSLRQALPYISTRLIVVVVVAVNVVAAALAFLFPSASWLWGVAWGCTILALIVYLLPRSLFQKSTRTAPPRVTRTALRAEPEIDAGARVNPIGWAISIGFVLLGQVLLMLSGQAEATTSPLAQQINDTLLLALTGDTALILFGVMALIVGTVLFAIITRRAALSDYRPLSSVEADDRQQRIPWVLLAGALAGIFVWLLALKSASGDPAGQAGLLPWLIALGLIAACWWQIDRLRGVRLSVRIDRREVAALALALIAILVVFSFQLREIPNSVWGDEGAFYTTARDVGKGVFSLGVFGQGTYAEPAFTTLFQSWIIKWLGSTLTAWRLSSVIAMWLAALPLYFLVRVTLGKRTAWIALAFFAVSPYVLTYARLGYDAAQAVWPVVLALTLTWLAVQRDSRLYAFLAGVAAGSSFFVPASARIAVVLVPLWLLWMWITRRVGGKTIGRQLAVVALGMLVVAAPPIVVGLSNAPSDYLNKQFESSFNNVFYARDFYPEDQLFEWNGPIYAGQQQLFYDPQLYAPLITRGVIRTALAFHLPVVVRENFLVGSLADPFGVLYLFGLAWCCARFRRSGYAIWPIWLLLGGFLTSALSTFPPRSAFMLPIVPALVTLGALGLTASIDVVAQVIGNVPERIKSYGLIGVTLILAVLGLRTYFVEMPQHFPPDLENAVFWEAQSAPPGTDLTLIQPDGLPDNYVPWGLQEFDLGVNYHLVKKADLPATDWRSLCTNGCRFVYASADRDEVYPYLAQTFGERAPKEIRNADGSIQLYVYVP